MFVSVCGPGKGREQLGTVTHSRCVGKIICEKMKLQLIRIRLVENRHTACFFSHDARGHLRCMANVVPHSSAGLGRRTLRSCWAAGPLPPAPPLGCSARLCVRGLCSVWEITDMVRGRAVHTEPLCHHPFLLGRPLLAVLSRSTTDSR